MPKIRIKEWDSELENDDGWLFFEDGRYYYYQDKPKCGKTFEIDKIEYDDDGDLDLFLTRLESIFYSKYIPKEMFEIIEDEKPSIKDSGERSLFKTGAVRDIQKGKGRMDLLPLCELGQIFNDYVFTSFEKYMQTNNIEVIHNLFKERSISIFGNYYNAIREVSIQFEEGAEKYGENNWRKGIPKKCYINSALRHYTKFLEGLTDERHDRAFLWNVLCLIWTHNNIKEDIE